MAVKKGFTLIETLVVISLLAVLISILLPALSRARESGRGVVCLANLRQCASICMIYADQHEGVGPAIGQPWGSLPNWALLVASATGREGDGPGGLYHSGESPLICPTTQAAHPQEMTRTYAMNATGHAGLAGDADSYDDAEDPGHINFHFVERPSSTPMLMDSAVAFFPSDAPPPTRTSSVLDFRQPSHVEDRLGRVHGSGRSFHIAAFDGSAGLRDEVEPHWREPLP